MSIPPRCATDPFRTLSLCDVDDICRWFLENRLLLNPSKTEVVLFGTRIQRDEVPASGGVDVAGTLVPFRDTVKLLGVTLDSAIHGPARHRGSPQLQLSHTGNAAHPTITDARCRQDAGTQHCHI